MSLVDRFKGRRRSSGPDAGNSLVDGALDTLDSLLRTLGELSFSVDDEDPRFQDLCKDYARHVTNGAPILDEGLPASDRGVRDWARVREFFRQRRQQECDFVARRSQDYRELIEGMVSGLAALAASETTAQVRIEQHLDAVSRAADRGDLTAVRSSLSEAISATAAAFENKKAQFEAHLNSTQSNLIKIRQDLAQAQDAMRRDPLTGTFDAPSFDSAVRQEASLSFVLQKPVTVGLLRIEDFAQMTAIYGQGASDEVVRAVADCLMRCFVRRSDTIATYGAGQFAVLLNDTNEDTAATLVGRLQAMVSDTVKIPYAPEHTTVNCVAGLTALSHEDTPESVFDRILTQLPTVAAA